MKKTIVALFSLSGALFGADTWVYNVEQMGQIKETSVHGFTFNLSASPIIGSTVDTPAVSDLSDFVYMSSLTMGERSTGGSQKNFGLLVVDTADTILGWSTGLCSSCETSREDNVFTFNNLKLSTNETYRFVTVNNVTNLTTSYVGWTYKYGKADTYTADSTEKELSGGLIALDVAVDVHDGTKTSNNLNFTTSPTFASTNNAWSPVLTDITVSIPEPTTATLSLLALASLAARRRRASR